MNDNIIEMKGVSRSFDKVQAVRELDLTVPRGCIYGFLGRNAAGKTTTIKMLAGLIRADEGSVKVVGADPWEFTVEDKRKVGYVSEKEMLPPPMRVGALVKFCAQFYPDWDHGLVERVLKRFRIDPKSKVKTLSLGQNRQLALLLALAQRPELLLLDEPAGGLDVVARREFLEEILELIREEGRTIFFSSHILSDVERVADQIGILANGSLRFNESLDTLKETVKQVRFFGAENGFKTFAPPDAFRIRREKNEALVTLRVQAETDLAEIAGQHGCQFEIRDLNLEDLFYELVRDSGDDAVEAYTGS
ncbi:MAG: ABC-2 type transport system ATP-binding protein [Limisphaerales bacterium]|jgi:ABC-2 type transport system ATP-binding protein